MINILYTLLICKDEGGSCDSDLWQALTKVILDLYINNFHDKLLYMYYGQINHFWFWFWNVTYHAAISCQIHLYVSTKIGKLCLPHLWRSLYYIISTLLIFRCYLYQLSNSKYHTAMLSNEHFTYCWKHGLINQRIKVVTREPGHTPRIIFVLMNQKACFYIWIGRFIFENNADPLVGWFIRHYLSSNGYHYAK